MKQCPKCHRTYSDNLDFCLDDGARLLVQDDSDATRVYPRPNPVGPTPVPRQSSMALGVIVAIVVVGLFGVLMVAMAAIWWSERPGNSTAAQNVNSAPPSYTLSESPSPAVTPYPSPSPSPSATSAELVENNISPGTYQCEVNQPFKGADNEGNGTLKYQFTFNSDGTYLMQGYITVYGTAINDLLGIEEKGTYSQSNRQLLLKDRLDREYNQETNSWKSWSVPSEGSESDEQVRNVTPTTFQLFYSDHKTWATFAKL
jgi:hypothetical protein